MEKIISTERGIVEKSRSTNDLARTALLVEETKLLATFLYQKSPNTMMFTCDLTESKSLNLEIIRSPFCLWSDFFTMVVRNLVHPFHSGS